MTTERHGEVMEKEKPTVLFELEPFLLVSPTAQSFVRQAIDMAYKLEKDFGGVSLKLTGSEMVNLIGEFRWKGSIIIKVRVRGLDDVIIYPPPPAISLETLGWGSYRLRDIFDLAFLNVVEQQLARLSEIKLNIENRRLARPR